MLALIGGTGFTGLEQIKPIQGSASAGPWGAPSAPLIRARLGGCEVLVQSRHGDPHSIAPHRVNYRANLWQLKQHGADRVIGINAVGTIDTHLVPGSLVLPDQLIDYTWGRECTFHDGEEEALRHIEFAQPFSEDLRDACLAAATSLSMPLKGRGCYGVTQGPRLETAAEIQRLKSDGCSLVGMTAMPEAALARELDLPYAIIAVVANLAAGLGGSISLDEIHQVLDQGMHSVIRLLHELMEQIDQG